MEFWGGEKIVFEAKQPCSICRRNYASSGFKFDGEQIIVSVCGYCAPDWPLRKIVDKINNSVKPKFTLKAYEDFQPRPVAPMR